MCRVVRFRGDQDLDLFAGLLVLVQGDQREHVVVAGRAIAWRGREHRLEQCRRVLRELVLVRDLRQHPQCLDVVRLALQVTPDQVLGLAQVAVGEHAASRHHLGGQGGKLGDVLRRIRGFLRAPDHLVERCQQAPARRQRRVQLDGA